MSGPEDTPLVIQRSNQHADDLLSSLAGLQRSATLTDFQVKVGGECVWVHGCVLAASCEYIRVMLASGMRESRERVLHLEGMDFRVVETVIRFIYGDAVTVHWDDDRIKQYLDIAESFGLSELKRKLEGYIVDHLGPENCIEWLRLAERYRLKKLRAKSRKMLHRNFVKASMSPAFEALSLSELQELISDDAVKTQLGDNILSTCIYWVLSDEANRKTSFGQILQGIELERCSPSYLTFVMDSYKDILLSDGNVHAQMEDGKAASMKYQEYVETRNRTAATHMDRNTKHFAQFPKSIIAVGGQRSILTLNRSAFKLDFQGNSVGEMAKLPDEMVRFFPARCLTPRGVFSAGGGAQCLPSTATQDVTLFDVSTGHVTRLPSLSFPLYSAGASGIGTRVYVMGGFGREDQTHFLDLDSPAGSWGVGARMKLQVQRPIARSIGRDIYVLSNTSARKEISLQCYDSANNVWTIRARPPDAVTTTNGACAVVVRSELFVLGGDGRLCLRYATMEDRWAMLSRPVGEHGYGSALHISGSLFLCGGRQDGVYSALIEVYDIRQNHWQKAALQLPFPLLDVSVYVPDVGHSTGTDEDDEDMWVVVKGQQDHEDLATRASLDNIKCEMVG